MVTETVSASDRHVSFLRTEFGSRGSSPSDKQLLTVYDLDNKFIAYSAAFDDVIDVVAEWGSFYILTRDGNMFVLQEKDTQTKLEVGQTSFNCVIVSDIESRVVTTWFVLSDAF